MHTVTEETLKRALKPMDLVSDSDGNVGIIQEVSVNTCQDNFDDQISYAVKWLVGNNTKHAWFAHRELMLHCNVLVTIAEMACHPMGDSKQSVQSLFNNFDR